MFLEISHKIHHKENTCVRVSFSNFIKRDFGRDFFKRDFGTCFPVNFAKFLRTPFSQLLACSLGDCCFFLLIFISPSFHLIVASQLQVPYIYSVSLFYNLTNFYDTCSYLSSLLEIFLFCNVLCSPFLPTERSQTVLLIKKCEMLFPRLFLARQNATRLFRIILNITAFYHSG